MKVMSVQGTGFKRVMLVKDAQQVLLDKIKHSPEIEEVPINDSLDRIIAQEIISTVNIPGFKRSAMDGYAVLAEDTYGASETSPVTLKISNTVEIGDLETSKHLQKTVTRISTGAPLPEGANAVIKLEDTEMVDDRTVDIISGVNVGTNVSKEDEDVKKGTVVYKKGDLIKPWDIAMLASIELNTVKVFCKPRISVLSTGNELVPIGSKTKLGQVVDSNRPAIVSWLSKFNVDIVHSSHCNDEPSQLEKKLTELVVDCDLIITTGGTSVGTKDYLPPIIDKLGELWVHGIAIRPGKPVAIGIINHENKSVPIIALPGYPLAAFINFELFVGFLLSKWTLQTLPWIKMATVKLKQKVPSSEGLRDFVRLKHTEDGAEIIRITGAGILSSLVEADYMLEVPEDVEGYHEGDIVEVRVLRG